jgi:hypothetical protein
MRLSFAIGQWLQVPPFGLAVLHILGAALLVTLAIAWGRHARRWLLMWSGFVTLAVITLVFVALVQPTDIPTDWITVLTRGFERKSIMHLYARGAHTGPNFDFVLSAVAGGRSLTLYDVVWLNLLLAAVNAGIFVHLAIYVARLWWALAWTLVFALNPAMFLASFSELPTNLLAFYFLAGLLAWNVLNEALPYPRVIRAAAGVFCGLMTILVALTRLEVSLIGVTALALYAGHRLLGADGWEQIWARVRCLFERTLAFLCDHLWVVAFLSLIAWRWPFGVGREEFFGLYPFNPSFLGLFVFIPMLGIPIGGGIAMFFGFARAVWHFRRFGGLPLSLLVIIRSYFGVHDSYLEMGRYLSNVLPAVICLGLLGKEQLDATLQRLRPNSRRLAYVVYIMSWFTLPLPGVLEFYLRSEYTEPDSVRSAASQLLLDRNTQKEVRHLLTLTEKNPQCVFIGRVIRDQGNFRLDPHYDYVAFGGPVSAPVFASQEATRLEDFIARHAGDAACVRLHYGSDCNVRFGDRCKEFVAGRRLIDEERFWSRPYNSNPWDTGAPEIILATYAWP